MPPGQLGHICRKGYQILSSRQYRKTFFRLFHYSSERNTSLEGRTSAAKASRERKRAPKGDSGGSPFTAPAHNFESSGKITKNSRFRTTSFLDQSRAVRTGTHAISPGPLPFTAPAQKSFGHICIMLGFIIVNVAQK